MVIKIRDLILIVVVVALSAGSIVGYLSVPDDSSPGNGENQSSVTANDTDIASAANLDTNTDSSGLSVQGASDTVPLTSTKPTLPAPADFGQYEKYHNAENTLYVDEVVGRGQEASLGDSVAMKYTGWLTTGEMFDQTRNDENGKLLPFIFKLGEGRVIQGWEQGVAGMRVGGKRRLVIPAALAYGPTPRDTIPANSMLIFDLELLAIQPQ